MMQSQQLMVMVNPVTKHIDARVEAPCLDAAVAQLSVLLLVWHQRNRLMEATVEHLQHELSGVRTGRANPGLLENLLVDAHGDRIPIKACGSVTVKNSQLLAVVLYDITVRVINCSRKCCGNGINTQAIILIEFCSSTLVQLGLDNLHLIDLADKESPDAC
jgi:hypothetical protein